MPGEFRLGRYAPHHLGHFPDRGIGLAAGRFRSSRTSHEYVEWMREQQTTDEFLREADRLMREQNVIQRVEVNA